MGLMDSGSGAYSVLCLADVSDRQQRGSGRSLALEHKNFSLEILLFLEKSFVLKLKVFFF